MDDSEERETMRTFHQNFIDGSHILHHHRVLDAYGHLSFRHPLKPDNFVMSRSIAPGIITSPSDLIEYRVEDAEPAFPSPDKGYAERMIHSEIYKRHPDIRAIVHSHSEAVLPYTISSVPLRACYHMAPFLGSTGVPVFDAAQHLGPNDVPDMLIRTSHLGAALAKSFDNRTAVTLMRGHGLTIVAHTIESAVLRAVYTQKNADIQTTALTLQAAFSRATRGDTTKSPELKYLSDVEVVAATDATNWSIQRPWQLWVREVRSCPLYLNAA